MGITDISYKRIQRYQGSILELGCQNLYFIPWYGDISNMHFKHIGRDITTWDIQGCNGAEIVDLRHEVEVERQYDLVTDFGTLEHVDGNYYMAHKNIHNHCKVGGIIIHENPKTGNWIGHGCNYVDTEFYRLLAEGCGYEIIELTEEAAMGNVTDGWNISVVLRKLHGGEFISEEQFNNIGHVFSK